MTSLIATFVSLEWTIAKNYPIRIVFNMIHIAMIITLFFFISQTLGQIPFLQGKYFPFVASGLAFQYLFSGTINASPSKTLEWRDLGILESLIHSPTASWKVYLTAGSYDVLLSIIKSSLVVTGVLYFSSAQLNIPWFITSLLLTVTLSLSLSLISTCSFLLWKKVSIIEMGGSISSLFLAGIYFPINILPKPLTYIAYCNPVYHGLIIFRKSLGIHSPDMTLQSAQTSLMIVSTWIIATVLFSTLFYRYTQKRILSKGSISHH